MDNTQCKGIQGPKKKKATVKPSEWLGYYTTAINKH